MARIDVGNGLSANYDNFADTLYISLGSPKRVDTSCMDDNYVIVRKLGEKVIGITIDGFKDRHVDNSWNSSLVLSYFPDADISAIEKLISN